MTELMLWRAYGGAIVSRPCCCGGWVRCLDNEKAIAYAVEAHNASEAHGAWAIAAGWR